MKSTKRMSSYEYQYRNILKDILSMGHFRNDRTGVGSYSLFNESLKIDLKEGFPLLTGRKMFEKTFKTEFDWFINGETNIKRFQDNGIKIWDAWADENGDLGPVYGHQLRNFNGEYYDQLAILINNLKTTPDSRRHIISLWNPLQLEEMALPPCYLYFQFFVEGDELNMFVVQRSGDVLLGIPYDVALFAQIQLYIAEQTGYKASRLEMQIIDAHIYKNQIDTVKQYLEQETFLSPEYTYKDGKLEIKNYQHGPKITAAVAV
jgi:thymidylate synthase